MLPRYHDALLSNAELAVWFASSIEVIPAVDVLGEEAVRLHQGAYDEVVERPGDPLSLASRFAAAGAQRLHFVDLDGARSGGVRPELVRLLAHAGAPARLQASGGIRSLGDAQALLAAGAERVVVALDVRDGIVRSAGWTRGSGLSIAAAVERCVAAGITRALCTAIDRDGTLAGPDLELVSVVAASGVPVLAAGGIRTPGDVEALAENGAEAAIVGRALVNALS